MHLVILGATGGTGHQLVSQALAAGHTVTAYVRHPEKMTPQPGLQIVEGELSDVPGMAAAMHGADAVLVAIGPRPSVVQARNADLMQRGVSGIIQAMHQARIDRLVLLSAFGVGDSVRHASLVARIAYKSMMLAPFLDKQRSELELPASGLAWTLVYPVRLTEGPRTTTVRTIDLEELTKLPGMPQVSRADVAAVMLDLAARRDCDGRTIVVTN